MILTAVGGSKKPASYSNAKHWLFRVSLQPLRSRPLSGDPFLSRDSRQISLSLGPIRDKYSQRLWVMETTGLTPRGNSLSDSLGFSFSVGPTLTDAHSCDLSSRVMRRVNPKNRTLANGKHKACEKQNERDGEQSTRQYLNW